MIYSVLQCIKCKQNDAEDRSFLLAAVARAKYVADHEQNTIIYKVNIIMGVVFM